MKKLCIAAIILCILFGGCSKKKEIIELIEPVGVNLDTTKVTRRDIFDIITYNAHIIPYTEELCFNEDGMIGEIKVDMGDTVEKGQVLATLDDSSLQDEIESLQDNIAYLKKENNYTNSLLECDIEILEVELNQLQDQLKLSSEEEKKGIELNIEIKKADINIAKTKLSQSIELQEYELNANYEKISKLSKGIGQSITAPFAGEIVYITTSHMVTKDSVIIAIADNSKLHMECQYINPKTIEKSYRYYALTNNKQYAITYEPIDMGDKKIYYYNGKDNSMFRLSDPDNSNLSTDDFLYICFINNYAKNVLSVPNQAIYRDSSGDYVYLIKGDAKIQQSVSLGESTSLFTEILDGLEEGDEVYVEN